MNKPVGWVLLVGVAGLVCGCAGYRLGSPHALGTSARTVFVQPVVNETTEPRVGEALTSALRRHIQQDGTFALADKEESDLILAVTATAYGRQAISFHPDDVVRPRDLQVTLQARARVIERNSGQVLLDRQFAGRQWMRIGPDMAAAERQALPMVAEDLARLVVLALAEGAW